MQYKSLALFIATAIALPTCDNDPVSYSSAAASKESKASTISTGDKFGLIAIRSGSEIQYVGVTASKGNFLIGGTNDAQCDKKSSSATFYIDGDGNANLYSTDAPHQQAYVDRSGMGQGVWGYTTGAQPTPRNAERSPFSINEDGHFVFDGKSPQACPVHDGKEGWTIWWSELEKPGYNENCTGIALRAIKSEDPISCHYSEES